MIDLLVYAALSTTKRLFRVFSYGCIAGIFLLWAMGELDWSSLKLLGGAIIFTIGDLAIGGEK